MDEQQSRMTAFAQGNQEAGGQGAAGMEPLVTIGNPALEIARLAEEKELISPLQQAMVAPA
jgi:hypothetical protein